MKKYMTKFLYLLLLLIVFLLHVSYINNGFVWLDHGDIQQGRAILPPEEFSEALFTRFGETGFYRPLVTITESLDYYLYGNWAGGYHITNIVLHLFVVASVPLFLSVFFTFTLPETLLIMFLVGVHPLGWLPVGAIAYRSELLLALFTFLTLFLHSKARKTGSSSLEFVAVISFFLALLSKETAVVIIPLLILLFEITQRKHRIRSRLSLLVPECAVLGSYLLLRMQAVPELWRTSSGGLSADKLMGTHLFAFGHLLFDFVSPLQPALSDAVPITSVVSSIPLGIILLFVLVIIIIKHTGFTSEWGRLLSLFIILLSPALGIIPVPRLGSPHYGYSALVLYAVLLILLLRRFRKPIVLHRSVYIIVLFLLGVMSYTTFMGGYRFANDAALFLPEVKKDPRFLEGHFYLGNYYLVHNQLASAEDAYKNALKISPEVIAYTEKDSTLYNLALTQTKRKKYQTVIDLLTDKEELHRNPELLLLFANALHYTNKDTEARQALQEAKPFWTEEQQKKADVLINLLKK